MNFGDERLPDRFWARCTPEPNSGCWLWLSGTNGAGYGKLTWGGRSKYAHRVAYEFLVGQIPAHLEIDHRCRNTLCCNPAHLEPVTSRENKLRSSMPALTAARFAAITHCPRGHEYTPDNTAVFKTGDGRPSRHCKQCVRDRAREYQRRKRAA